MFVCVFMFVETVKNRTRNETHAFVQEPHRRGATVSRISTSTSASNSSQHSSNQIYSGHHHHQIRSRLAANEVSHAFGFAYTDYSNARSMQEHLKIYLFVFDGTVRTVNTCAYVVVVNLIQIWLLVLAMCTQFHTYRY